MGNSGHSTRVRGEHKKVRRVYEYTAGRKVCGACPLKKQCTRSQVRTIRGHEKHIRAQTEPCLVAHRSFDEEEGLAVRDSSGNGLNGKIVNAENVKRVEGKSGKAPAWTTW